MTNPTIKLLEEAWLRHINGWYSHAETYGLECLADRDKELIDTALRTLIEKHEDVEGELKPCPFCGGGEAFKDIVKDRFGCLEGSIACDCGIRGECIENIADGYATDEEAIDYLVKKWNTRADTIINEITRRIEDGDR